MQKGEIDAVSHLEPVLSFLERAGEVRVVVDTRTEEGTRALFGGSNPAAVLYAKKSFIDQNPRTMQALTNVFYKTLQWLKTASPEDIAATVPPEYLLGDKELYMLSAKNSKASYSLTGVLDPSGMKSTSDMLTKFDPELAGANVDLSKTFDDRFVKQAAELVK
jgi:NitT/TauT family transport system substrate-binding protein